MTIAEWAPSHRRSILFLLVLLAVGGAVSALSLSVALFPQVDFPRIVVSLDAGDRPADQMILQITRPIEQAIRAVPGITEVRSTTSRGSAEISVNLAWGSDMPQAALQTEAAINQVLPSLPAGTSFSVRRMDPTVFPVAAYSLTSTRRSLAELHDFAEYQLLPLLSSVDGVARVTVLGGEETEYHVDVSPAQLAAYGLALDDVVKALSAANILQAVGRVEDHYKLFLVLSDTRLQSPDDMLKTIIRSGDNGIVTLGDIATVKTSAVPQWLRVTANGRDAVSLQIYQQPAGNTVKIVQDIQARLAQFKDKIPAGVKIENWYDQSELITASATTVRDAILIGAGLAALVLLAFLRSVKITLIAVLVVPAVLTATVLVLTVFGMSFNIMTLGGMAAAIGLIVDDAIVMIEHIIRRLRGAEGPRHERVRLAADEFLRPLTGSSASTIIIFLPLAFLSGVTGAFFKALSLTMASALIISFFVAWLAVPLLGDRLLSDKDAKREDSGRATRAVQRHYRRVLEGALARPWLIAVFLVPLLAIGYLAYSRVGSGFMPHMDEGGFVLDYRAPPGTSLAETDRLLRQVEALLVKVPEVVAYSRRTGAGLGGTLAEANNGDFFVRLKPPPRRPIDEVMNDIRQQIVTKVPGLEIEMALLMEDLIGDLTAVPQPIEIKLYGDNTDELLATAPKVAQAIGKVTGVVDVNDGIVLAGDALDIEVNRTKAAVEGVDPDAVTHQLDVMLNGTVTTTVEDGVKLIGIRVHIAQAERQTIAQIAELQLRAPDGHLFPLRRIATLHQITGQPEITRDNLKRMVAITGRISGRDLGSTVRDVTQTLNEPGLIPTDLYYELGGLYQQQQIAFRGLIAVFASAIALVFVVLLFMYERFRVALVILAMPMLAVAAVFIGLWVTGVELNITAMMGMTMVIGIVTEVAIFYFSEYQALIEEGADRCAALVDAGVNRMRPIAMTTLAAILALLPLALALGQGSAMQQPLAIAIIAGLVVQMPLVLVVMPVLFERIGGRLD
jgi:CzcA family heavy metal efflux pump